MAPSSTSIALMAGSALIATAAAKSYFFSSSKDRYLGDIDDLDENVEYITQDDVCKIFDALFLEMQTVLQQLYQQIQALQSQGQQIPEAQLRVVLKSEFEKALLVRQAKVFDDFGVDADCLEEAVWEFMADEDEKVIKSVERFQKLYENVSGERVVGTRPGVELKEEEVTILGPEETIEAATIFFDAVTNCMRELVDSYKADGKSLQDPAVAQELQMKFTATGNDAGEEALKTTKGISFKSFQKSLETNAPNPTVARALQMIQMKQQQEMMALTQG